MEVPSLSSRPVCRCRPSIMLRPYRASLWTVVWTAVCVLLLAKESIQDEYSFSEEPERYYYQLQAKSFVIPCIAQVTRDDGTIEGISPSIIIDSEPLDVFNVNDDSRFLAHVTQGTVVGLLVIGTTLADSGKMIECAIIVNNRTIESVSTFIYVGDGSPLMPTSPPVQTSDSLYSISLDWGESPVPVDYPLLGYTLVLTELLEMERIRELDLFTNDTNSEVNNLLPGVEYRVVVYGRNEFGAGQRSSYHIARTASPIVPSPPSEVRAMLESTGTDCNIILSWTPTPIETDVMTPLTHFVIFYGSEIQNLRNYTTDDALLTTYSINGLTKSGNFTVGVSAVNSAGVSETSFTEVYIDIPTTATEHDDPIQLTTIIAIAGGVFVLILIIGCVLIILCIMKYRTKRLAQDTFDMPVPVEELDGSPSVKRIKGSSPEHLKALNGNYKRDSSEASYSSTELHTYGSEPRRVGSKSPSPVEMGL